MNVVRSCDNCGDRAHIGGPQSCHPAIRGFGGELKLLSGVRGVEGSVGSVQHDLGGRNALVTGASRGIGAAVARALDAAGARVALAARTEDACRGVAAELRNDPVLLGGDLAHDGAAEDLALRAQSQLGRVDIVVNNAGVGRRVPSATLTGDDIDLMYRVNVRSLLLLTTALIPAMVERGAGAIVNVSSISGVRGAPMRAAYAATKGAVDALTRSLAMELGPHGVRVNAVAPGVVETDMWTDNLARPGVRDEVVALVPLRRLSSPEEVASVVLFLVSDASSYLTGETLCVDGGLAMGCNLYPSV